MSKSIQKKKLGILVLLKISVTRAKSPENTDEKAVFRGSLCHTSYPAWKTYIIILKKTNTFLTFYVIILINLKGVNYGVKSNILC